MKKIRRTPSDEFLLTELAIDRKDITIYDISSVFLVGEKATQYNRFKCYMDHTTKEFFVEVTSECPLKKFTQSTVLNLLDTAEKEGAERVYVCVRKDMNEHAAYIRAFNFIGFKTLSQQEQDLVSMTITHTLLEYDLKSEGDLDSL
eukprot:TRINITY_DN1076_c0_g1_i1.p1 TRINITY_DN1076_c0_g1~~TRINITY_DN1076_c0_g1_i1.p1  ORF type:complete len:146 (-),score=37.08 TRINITY_DN1076_c0_g1_i1:301-738(-)